MTENYYIKCDSQLFPEAVSFPEWVLKPHMVVVSTLWKLLSLTISLIKTQIKPIATENF